MCLLGLVVFERVFLPDCMVFNTEFLTFTVLTVSSAVDLKSTRPESSLITMASMLGIVQPRFEAHVQSTSHIFHSINKHAQ